MANLQTNLTVPIKTPLADASGNLSLPWIKFFQSLIGAVIGANEAITSAGLALDLDGDVRGASQLNDAGAIPKVESPGVLAESAITDDGTEVTVGNRNLGIGMTGSVPYPLDVRSSSTASQVHVSGTNADSGLYLTSENSHNANLSAGADYNSTNWVAKDTSACILALGTGTGGMSLYLNTGLTVGNTFTPSAVITINTTGAGFGGNTNPQYPVDATGDINTSTKYRVGGTAGLSTTVTLAKLTSGGSNGSLTITGGIVTAYSAPS